MWTTPKLRGSYRIRAVAWLLSIAVAISAAGLGGCAPIKYETGRKFDPGILEQSLRSGESTQADVRKALGEPFGTGRALMPFHESTRTIWTFSFQRGSIDIGSGQSQSDILLLFVFFAGDRYEGYMWGGAEIASAKPQ